MKKLLESKTSFFILFFTIASTVLDAGQTPELSKVTHNASLRKTAIRSNIVPFDINAISTFIGNDGTFNREPVSLNAGFEWPKWSKKYANYASGIWLGGKVAGSLRVADADYFTEYDAGPIAAGVDPFAGNWKVYKIRRGDNAATNPDYASWPVSDGAPALRNYNNTADSLDANGKTIPGIIGDMTVWAVFNDNNPSLHSSKGTAPLGIEVQLTAYAFNLSGPLGNTIFYKWKLINKGGNIIDSTYFSIWSDVDLGNATDDYNGCDTTLYLGYTYNGTANDASYGTLPPAAGFDFLQGPLVNGSLSDTARFPDGRIIVGKRFMKLTSYVSYSNGDTFGVSELGTSAGAFNNQKGLSNGGGTIRDNNGNPTKFMFPGDPNFANGPTNWTETGNPGDRRFLMSAGPFTMAPNDMQEIVAANLIGLGANYTASVTALKNSDKMVQRAFDFNLASIPSLTLDVSYPTIGTAGVRVKADARNLRLKSLITTLKRQDGSKVADIALYDDGIHDDGTANDGIFGSVIQIVTRESGAMYIDLNLTDASSRVLTVERVYDGIPTIGPLDVTAPVVFSDNINNDLKINPGENIRYGMTVKNNTVATLSALQVATEFQPLPNSAVIPQILAGGQYSYSYNPNNPTSYFNFYVPSDYQDPVLRVRVTLSDALANVWIDTLSFPVTKLSNSVFGSPVSHIGPSDWGLSVSVIDRSVAKNNVYEISVIDSINVARDKGFSLKNLATGATLITNHEMPDALGHNMPVTDGFKILRGAKFGALGLRYDSTRWISPNPAWLQGYNRFGGSPYSAFIGGVLVGFDLPKYLGAVQSSFDSTKYVPVEIRFDQTNPQKAYRLRRVGGIDLAYTIQQINPFVNVPFSVWDVSGSTPRQLTVGWRDQNNSFTYDPPVGNDGTEVIFIYNRSYNPAGGQWPYQDSTALDTTRFFNVATIGPQADIMYAVSLGLVQGHTMNENTGTLFIRPFYLLSSKDKYQFNPTNVLFAKDETAPTVFSLDQNFPNPFNPATTIRFSTSKVTRVTLTIYDVLGREVTTIVNEKVSAGQYSYRWEGRNATGSFAASGVYFYRLVAGDFVGTKKMLLLK